MSLGGIWCNQLNRYLTEKIENDIYFIGDKKWQDWLNIASEMPIDEFTEWHTTYETIMLRYANYRTGIIERLIECHLNLETKFKYINSDILIYGGIEKKDSESFKKYMIERSEKILLIEKLELLLLKSCINIEINDCYEWSETYKKLTEAKKTTQEEMDNYWTLLWKMLETDKLPFKKQRRIVRKDEKIIEFNSEILVLCDNYLSIEGAFINHIFKYIKNRVISIRDCAEVTALA